MHEYSLMKDVIETILKQLKNTPLREGETVKKVSFKIGALDIHSEESFKQAFTNLIRETPLEKAELKLEIIPGQLECNNCGHNADCPTDKGDGHESMPAAECPKCGLLIPIKGGRGITELQLDIVKKD